MSTTPHAYTDLSSEDQQLMTRYQEMAKTEFLQIQPAWNKGGQGTGTVLEVDPAALVQQCHDLGMPYKSLFNGSAGDVWFAKNLQKWEAGTSVNPPNVELDGEGRVIIADGKHRAILAYYLGQETLPIEVPAQDTAKVKELLAEKD